MSGSDKKFAGTFLNDIQNQAYLEVTDANNLTFTFAKIAEDINTSRIQLNKSNLELEVGKQEQLQVTFVDGLSSTQAPINWRSMNSSIASVNSSGVVKALKTGNTIIRAESGNFYADCPVTVVAKAAKKKITVVINENHSAQNEEDDDDYQLSVGATLTSDGQTYTSGSDGKITFPLPDSGEITVSKTDYVSRYIGYDEIEDGDTIYLQKKSNNPTITSVTLGGVDILVDELMMDLTDASTSVFHVDVDWGKSSYGNIWLEQGATKLMFDNDSYNYSVILSQKFDVSKDIYVVAKDAAGHTTKKGLSLTASGMVDCLDGISFSIGDSISFSLPDSIPLVGGEKVKLGVDTGTLPIEVSVDDGKIYVTVGVDVAKYSKSDKYATSVASGNRAHVLKEEKKLLTTTIVNGVKKDESGNKGTSVEDIKKSVALIKQKYKSAMKFPKGSFGFDADFTIIGFLEGYLDSNKQFKLLDSGLILNPSVGANWGGQLVTPIPVPLYWEAAIKGEIAAQINMYINKHSANYLPRGSVDGSVSGSIGAGVGVTKAASVGGGGKLEIKQNVTFFDNGNANDLHGSLSLNFYVKVTLALLEWKHDFDPVANVKWGNGSSTSRIASLSTEDLFDTDNYVLEALQYLDDHDISIETLDLNDPAQREALYAASEMIFDRGSYSETSPEIVKIGDNSKLAVWRDSKSSDMNDVQLYYSYFDGASWSTPALIDEDGTADLSPSVVIHNRKAYVIWQNAEKAFTEEELSNTGADFNMAEYMGQYMGIKVASFDTSTEKFTVADLSKNSGYLDMMPVLHSVDGQLIASWVENKSQQWFGASKNNSIHTANLSAGSWNAGPTLVENTDAITSQCVDIIDGNYYAIYTMDAFEDTNEINKDVADNSDIELYVNGKKVTDNLGVDSAVQLDGHDIYWHSCGSIVTAQNTSGSALTGKDLAEQTDNLQLSPVMDATLTLASDDFKIITDDESKAMLYTIQNEANTDVYASIYSKKNACWNQPIQLTDSNAYISSFGAIWDDDAIQLICNKIAVKASDNDEIGEETYGQTSLELLKYKLSTMLTVDDCIYDDSQIVANGLLPVSLILTNSGIKTISGYNVIVKDKSGNKVSDIDFATEKTEAGETAELEFNCPVKAADLGSSYTVTVTPMTQSLKEGCDNTATIELKHEDVKLEMVSFGKTSENEGIVYGTVTNAGFTAQNNLTVSLYKDSVEGTKVGSIDIASLNGYNASSEEYAFYNVSFPVNYEEDAVYCMVVTGAQNDITPGNDMEYVHVVAKKTDDGRTLNGMTASKRKVSYKVGETLNVDDILVESMYDDGSKADVSFSSSIDVSSVNMARAGSYVIKVSYENYRKEITITVTDNGSTSGTTGGGSTVTPTTPTTPVAPTSGNYQANNANYQVSGNNVNYVAPVVKNATIITIPDTIVIAGKTYPVTGIANNAFINNKVVTKVIIGKNVQTIGVQAFSGCSKLKTVVMNSTVLTSIQNKAFYKCTALTSIVIPAKVSFIGASAFNGCKKLKTVNVKTKLLTTKNVGGSAFKNIYAKATVKVPKAKKKAYQKLFKKKGVSKKTQKIK
ncbi:MAG: leucine-rich repeat protein [Eubacteriales bacterium]|nr:leucine-rich repeat protein [Eubacteriales bacterium]